MSVFPKWLSVFGRGGLSTPDKGPQLGFTASLSTDAGITVSDERALQVSSVWACVDIISKSVCSLPISLYKRDITGTAKEYTRRHYITDLLHRRPNAHMKPRDFRKAMTAQLVMWTNAYAEIFYSGDRPVALMPLKPERMTPYMTDSGLVYHYQTEKGVRILSKRSVLHLKGMNVDGIGGLNRSHFARNTTGLSVSADVYASKQFANGGNTGAGHLSFDKFLTTTEREQARALYENASSSAYNKGKIAILEGGVTYNETGLNPDTMQMIETRKWQVSEIARFYGVPEVLIGGGGNSSSSWPASFEQQMLAFLTFTLQDYIDEWEHAIHYSLIQDKDKDSFYVDHDVTGFIKMDSQAKANIQSTWVQNGLKTRNEIRKINNDPPKSGGDDLTVQVNLTPVDQLPKATGGDNASKDPNTD